MRSRSTTSKAAAELRAEINTIDVDANGRIDCERRFAGTHAANSERIAVETRRLLVHAQVRRVRGDIAAFDHTQGLQSLRIEDRQGNRCVLQRAFDSLGGHDDFIKPAGRLALGFCRDSRTARRGKNGNRKQGSDRLQCGHVYAPVVVIGSSTSIRYKTIVLCTSFLSFLYDNRHVVINPGAPGTSVRRGPYRNSIMANSFADP